MNTFWKIFLLLALLVIGAVIYVNSKIDQSDRQKLESDLSDAILQNINGEIPAVDFAKITTFSWDRLYIFEPYTSTEELDHIFGNERRSFNTSIESNDGIILLVFTKDGRVVQYLDYGRGLGDYAYANNEAGYLLQEARFVMDERGRMIWVGGE
jgi:hypothetical protein